MKVKYTGNSDFQVFDASDFKKADVEGKKTTFPKGEAVEVSDEVGTALTSSEGIFGQHSFEQAEDEEENASDENSDEAVDIDPEPAASGKAAKTEGTTSEATTTTRSTGRGSSTRTR